VRTQEENNPISILVNMRGPEISKRKPARIVFPRGQLPEPEHSYRRPFVISLFAHTVVLALLWIFMARSVEVPATGTDEGRPGGGGGGGGPDVSYVVLPPYQSAPLSEATPETPVQEVPPIVLVPTHKLVPITAPLALRVQPTRMLPPAKARGFGPGVNGGPGEGTGTGGGIGSGTGTGHGSGVGPGTGGDGGDILPPSVRFSALPPIENRPQSLRGRSFLVLFTVDELGRVADVTTQPEIGDGDYRQRFLDAMRRYRFNPATRRDGTAVAGHATVTVTL
jgi:periplasmic protein TonB